MSDDGPTKFEVVERAILDNYTASPGWIAGEVLGALDSAGFTVSR